MAEPAAHLVLAEGPDATFELEVRRSRFLALLRRTADEAAARAFVAEARRAHPTARHHPSAFVVGPGRELQRSSDDGEPGGTAGMPMLAVLLGSGGRAVDAAPGTGPLTDVTAVVVRWFGGTLLGAGGLVRAYGDAVSGALHVAPLAVRERRRLVRVDVVHEAAGRLERDVRAAGLLLRERSFGAAGVVLTLAVPDDAAGRDRVAAWAAEHRVAPEDAGTEWVDVTTTG